VKLLFDENLPPRLTALLADVYPGSAHVHQCALGASDDSAVWEYAKKNGFTIVSKDSDFQERSVLSGFPPKVIWLRTKNCSSAHLEFLLRAASSVIAHFLRDSEQTCLVLGHRPRRK